MMHRKVQEFGQAKMATAVLDYTAQEPGELTLRRGDSVEGRWLRLLFITFCAISFNVSTWYLLADVEKANVPQITQEVVM